MSDHAPDEDSLEQPCSEKDLASIAKQLNVWEQVYMYLDVTEPEKTVVTANHPRDYETQKIEILKIWKRKKGEFQGTFKALSEVFSRLDDQRMVGVIKRVAHEAYRESSEDSVIKLLTEFKAVNYDILSSAAQQVGILTDTQLETFEDAPNNTKKVEVILNGITSLPKPQLILFMQKLASLFSQVRSLPMLMSPVESPPPHSDIKSIEKNFRNTVNNIKRHLNQCDVQELVTNFNMVVDKEKFPYFKERVKRKLYKCKTVGDLLVRISPFVSWKKREVLRALVEASDCQEAVDELNRFEAQLDYGQPTTSFPIPPPSSEICPDPESDAIIVSAKSNQDLRKTSLKDIDHMTGAVVQAGGINEKDVDLQANNNGSSILYWLLPKNKVKSFEVNIRNNLDYLYAEGILEISLDPNIVITTGRKLRVRSLSYLTKLPPQDPRPLQAARPPQRAEELEELPSPDTKLPERAEEIVELAYQLKIDMRKREKEVVELDNEVRNMDNKVKNLERDKEQKEQECNQLKEQLHETRQKNEELKQIVTAQITREDTAVEQVTHHINSNHYVNLSFGIRGHTAVNCGGKVYIGGGVVSRNGGAADVIQVIDLSTQHVSQLPSCPVKHFGLVCIDNQVVTVGGKTKWDDQITGKLYCWKEATQQWEESLPAMPTPRHFLTSVVWNNYLIVCGGRIDNQDSITDCVEILNLQSKRWHTASSLPLQESGKRAVITDNSKLYLLGGHLGNAVHYCELHKLVASTIIATAQPQEAILVWRRLEDTPSTDCAAVSLRGSLVIIGGRSHDANKISSTILRYSNVIDEWERVGDLLYSRTACMAVALDYDTVLVTGGTVLHDQQPDWYSASIEIVVSH